MSITELVDIERRFTYADGVARRALWPKSEIGQTSVSYIAYRGAEHATRDSLTLWRRESLGAYDWPEECVWGRVARPRPRRVVLLSRASGWRRIRHVSAGTRRHAGRPSRRHLHRERLGQSMSRRHPITVISFGFLHDNPPQADVTLDLRRLLADPAHVPSGHMLDQRGDIDEAVYEFVLATPGASILAEETGRLVRRMARIKPIVVALGCAGGKHRAAAMARAIAEELMDHGCEVAVTHLHAHLPRVIKAR